MKLTAFPSWGSEINPAKSLMEASKSRDPMANPPRALTMAISSTKPNKRSILKSTKQQPSG